MNKIYYGKGQCSLQGDDIIGLQIYFSGAIHIVDKTPPNFHIVAKNNIILIFPYGGTDELKDLFEYKGYFKIDNMHFKQILYSNDLENELSLIDGVRVVNYVTLTQDRDYNSFDNNGNPNAIFSPPLYNTVINSDGTTSSADNDGYGYYYDFGQFYGISSAAGKGIVLPAYEPSVFELKDPNQNVKGIVR